MVRRLKKRSYSQWIVLLLMGVWIAILSFGRFRNRDEFAAPARPVEGTYQIEKVVDPITFHVRSLDEKSKNHAFRVRLVGVKIPAKLAEEHPDVYRELCRTTCKFLDATDCNTLHLERGSPSQKVRPSRSQNVIRLEFDRFHITSDQTALAHVLANGQRLNIKLAELGLVLPDPNEGNSASIARKIRLASHSAKVQRLGVFQGQPPIEQNKAD